MTGTGNIDKKDLETIIERIERLEAEKKALAEDIREIYSEAKSRGYDTKAIRTIIKLRKMDEQKRIEEETILDTYRIALGLE